MCRMGGPALVAQACAMAGLTELHAGGADARSWAWAGVRSI